MNGFTPSGTTDNRGVIGQLTADNDYIYIKGNDGWGRSSLETF